MKNLNFPVAEVAAAEQRVLDRRLAVKRQGAALAVQARRRLASPVALLAAAGAGYALASQAGRRHIGRLFSVLQLGLAALSAVKASV